MTKVTETADEAAEKIEMVIGQLARAKALKKAAADMEKGAKQFAENHGRSMADIKYAVQHMGKDSEKLDTLFEEEDDRLRERRHILDVLRRRKTPLEAMIAKAQAGMVGQDPPEAPAASSGGGNVTPFPPPQGRA